jgi:hypothetical protein
MPTRVRVLGVPTGLGITNSTSATGSTPVSSGLRQAACADQATRSWNGLDSLLDSASTALPLRWP